MPLMERILSHTGWGLALVRAGGFRRGYSAEE